MARITFPAKKLITNTVLSAPIGALTPQVTRAGVVLVAPAAPLLANPLPRFRRIVHPKQVRDSLIVDRREHQAIAHKIGDLSRS